MANRSRINVLHAVLTIFVFAAPVLGSVFEKSAIVYASLCLFAGCIGYRIYKDGYVVLTKTFLLLLGVSAFSFLQLIWVSDKGSQLSLGALFLMSAAGSLLIGDYKKQTGKINLSNIALRLTYSATLFYCVMAILHQIFIESRFFACSMNFGNGSAATSAFVAVWGIIATIKLFGKRKKQSAFYIALPVMLYVLIMSKSLIGYLFAFCVVFAWAMTRKHKKVEALASLVGCALLGVLNIINAIAVLVTNSESFNGAIKGLISIFGLGSGGYNAASSVVDKGYTLAPTVLSFILESYGVIGIAVIALAIGGGVLCYIKKRSFDDIVMLLLMCAVVLSSSATMAVTVPLIAMYYTCREEGYVLHVHKATALVAVVPFVASLVFASAHIPYALANHQCDMGRWAEGAAFYKAGAQMEIINSHAWEKAYKAYMKEFAEENEVSFLQTQKPLIEKAIKFNSKNYRYYRDMADVYTYEGDYIKALDVWNEIIIRHDKEYLYPMYAEKILDVMANCPVGLGKMEELYNTLDTYAKKAVDKNVVFEVNNILAQSQQYYVNAREGGNAAGDMYLEEDTEEVEYESSSAEG